MTDAWGALEAEWADRVATLAAVHLAKGLVEARMRACRAAEASLAAALTKARRAIVELDDATTVLELAVRAAGGGG